MPQADRLPNCHGTLGEFLTVTLTVTNGSVQPYLSMQPMEQDPCRDLGTSVYSDISAGLSVPKGSQTKREKYRDSLCG